MNRRLLFRGARVRLRIAKKLRLLGSALAITALPLFVSSPSFVARAAGGSPAVSTISSNFNGTPIAGGNYIWFNSVLTVKGLDPTKKTTISFMNSKIDSAYFHLNAPDADVTFDPAATTATTTFVPGVPGRWVTTVPSSGLAGNVFLDGLSFKVPPGGLPGGINPVTWSGTFSSATTGLTVQWKWAAAVYTTFSNDHNALGVKPVDDNKASAYKNSDHAGTPENFKQYVIGGARGGGGSNYTGGYSGTAVSPVGPIVGVKPGECTPSASLSVLVQGSNVTSYVPKGNWSSGAGTKNVAVVPVEGGGAFGPATIVTPNAVNSCASNFTTGETVCTANNTDVYTITGTTLNSTLTSGGSGFIGFSGGFCTNCGVTMDATHNRAAIGLSIAGVPGFQFLNLGPSTFEPAFASQSSRISEDPLIDPLRNLLLSASENNNYEIVDVSTSTSPKFFENPVVTAGELDSSGEDCSTGIALAPAEFSSPSQVYIADLTQATFIAGSPGTWTAPSQVQVLTESNLSAGASGISVAQGTHTGVVTGEFGGNNLTAIALPSTSGSGIPAIGDWVTCNIGGSFANGFDPHTVTAYQSPNTGDAIALLANAGATMLARVDLTKMLDSTVVPRTVLGHGCQVGTLPSSVVSFIPVP
jgi:hypothetical protein